MQWCGSCGTSSAKNDLIGFSMLQYSYPVFSILSGELPQDLKKYYIVCMSPVVDSDVLSTTTKCFLSVEESVLNGELSEYSYFNAVSLRLIVW